MNKDLRDEFLRLLREDVEFRYAVVGLLGISDVQSSLRQLIDALSKVLSVVGQLADAENRHMEVTQRILEELKRLADNQERLWEENNKIWQEIRSINENIEKLWKEVMDTRHEFTSLSRSYGGLSEIVGFLVEQNARHYLPNWVREELGTSIDRLRRRVVEGIGEFDGYAEVNNRVIVTEIKATLRLRDVEDFVNKVNKLRNIVSDREIIAIIAYVKEDEDIGKAIELARASGIRVARHFGEDDFEEVA